MESFVRPINVDKNHDFFDDGYKRSDLLDILIEVEDDKLFTANWSGEYVKFDDKNPNTISS